MNALSVVGGIPISFFDGLPSPAPLVNEHPFIGL